MENVSSIRSNQAHARELPPRNLRKSRSDPHAHTIFSMSQTETHVGSINGQEHEEVQKKVKSRRPASKLTPIAPRFAQRIKILFNRLTQYFEFYRYCLPATAAESMAVSASPTRFSGSAASALAKHTIS